jgi:hypothetical protein
LIIELGYTFANQLFVSITFKLHDRFLDSLGLATRLGLNFIARQPLKRLPGFFGQGFSQIRIPTQRDFIGMRTQQFDGPIDPGHTAFMTDPIARPVHQIKYLSGVGR